MGRGNGIITTMLDKFFSKIKYIIPARWHWVLDHEGFKRYFSNTGWMFAGQIFFLLLSFLVGAWVARYLGPSNYGALNYAISFAGIFTVFSSLGVDTILARDLVLYPERRSEFLGTATGLKLIGGFLALLFASIAAFLLESDPLIRILIILFSFSFIFQAFNVIAVFFQAEVKAKYNVGVQMAAAAISAILKIILVLSGLSIIWLIIIYALEALWQTLGFIYIYEKAGQHLKTWRFEKKLALELWHQGWLLLLAGAVIFVLSKIDQVIVGRMLGQAAVGIYAVAVKMAEISYFIPAVLCGSLLPAIANAKKNNRQSYEKRLRNFYGLMTVMAVMSSIIIFIFSRPVIIHLFGSEYEASISILHIYVWSGIGSFISTASYQHLLLENRLKLIFGANFIAMAANIALNIFLIPIWGLKGAALASVVSYFITPGIAFIFLAADRKLSA